MGKGIGCLGIGALLFVGFIAVAVLGQGDSGDAQSPPEPAEPPPHRMLIVEAPRGEKGGFGSVFMLSGTLRNTASYDIKDPMIRCDLHGNSGTQVGRVAATVYEIVPGNGKKRFNDLNMGFMGSDQVARFECEVIGATRADAIP